MLLRSTIALLTLATTFTLSACVTDDGESDDIDDPFIAGDGKSDVDGIQEGSPEAIGILRLVNEADQAKLKNGIKLDSRAVTALLAHRRGPDAIDGTADDDAIGSLAELDAISWVGPVAFGKLLAYANANGYIAPAPILDPWTWNFCGSDPSLSRDGVVGFFPLGGTEAVLTDNLQWLARTRTCNVVSGCSGWTASTGTDAFVFNGFNGSGPRRGSISFPAAGRANLILGGPSSNVRPFVTLTTDPLTWSIQGSAKPPASFGGQCELLKTSPWNSCTEPLMAGTAVSLGEVNHRTLFGHIGEHCLQLKAAGEQSGVQVEIVGYARY